MRLVVHAKILDGKALAAKVVEELRIRVAHCIRPPHLAVLIVGELPASQLYVKRKISVAKSLGVETSVCRMPTSVDEISVLRQISMWNMDDNIDGILVQAPLPSESLQRAAFFAINPQKDVDGFHPYNFGLLAHEKPEGFIPCTPKGIIRLLQSNNISLDGQRVVIIGRSLIVGRPLALLLQSRSINATVTVCHSRSKEMQAITTSADVLISAAGSPNLIGGKMVREGATFIDVGQNAVPSGSNITGKSLCGDGIFDELSQKCSNITPVPGGVGPMTIAMLMENLVEAHEKRAIK
jgi:methylenetetrahydrofolate dehydrogenase (NADP+)/methenyltetrahydrofolate cyclohydrolase